MFNNLRDELRAKNIPMVAYSKIIGCSEKSVQNKLSGVTEFTLSEIQATLGIFPEYRFDYLFATEEKTA